jgi:hypothetical protein
VFAQLQAIAVHPPARPWFVAIRLEVEIPAESIPRSDRPLLALQLVFERPAPLQLAAARRQSHRPQELASRHAQAKQAQLAAG